MPFCPESQLLLLEDAIAPSSPLCFVHSFDRDFPDVKRHLQLSLILFFACIANGIHICCVIEDEKVSTDWLEEGITANEDLVQSVDVVAFNKV
uniref:Translation elongation factor EF1B beta/delta subunit guanine nucleotide exchange domain-containing protein n=1 Tax=Ditylenchus dipsaci TaxID=166011 RepID=A0A915DF38_9BILA